jgi:hypothetical protein
MAMSFEQWKSKVDDAMERLCGFTSDDLPDWDYYSAWQDGLGWGTAAKQALTEIRECW